MNLCPCGTDQPYSDCCQPLHLGQRIAQTPTQLMRSRYCAFVKELASYIHLTHSPVSRDSVSIASISEWNSQCDWCGLQIITTPQDQASHRVEFIAWYKQNGELKFHHELSLFRQEALDDEFDQLLKITPATVWYYRSASYPDRKISLPKRNDCCICHSGKKFKKCCG